MSALISKNLRVDPIRVVGGSGARLYDDRGREYLDSCGGVAVSSLGHDHPRVAQAIAEQAASIAWAHAGTFSTAPAEELAEYLVSLSGGLAYAQFLSGGSEAMELALKIACQYHWERGEPGRQVFVARRQSYHGSTFGALAISDNLQRRDIFEPLLRSGTFVSPCYAYRDKAASETDAHYVARLAAELDALFVELGPQTVAGFVAETVVGSTSGAVPPVDGYLRAVRDVCDRHGVLLVLDEVMAGLGRTGRHFAYQDDGVVPDLVAVGKGLAAGYQPISGLLASQQVYDVLAGGSGFVHNGQTYVNHPVACAAALTVQRTIVEDDLLAHVRIRGRQLRTLLEELKETFPHVGDVRGRGLFLGVELVVDQESKDPLPHEFDFVSRMKTAGLDHGLLTYPGSGTIDGARGHHVLFAPPFTSTEAEIHEIVSRFSTALAAVFGGAHRVVGDGASSTANEPKRRLGTHDADSLLATDALPAQAQGRHVHLPDVLSG
jgi:adenosylmethionine-8-amino-7-oxononanoate aminotransferase